MTRAEIRTEIMAALSDAPFSMRDIADEMGVSYNAVRSWATGRRVPKRINVEQLAVFFEARAGACQELADRLRSTVKP